VRLIALLLIVPACGTPVADAREAFVIDTLAQDNYVYARREPATVAMKLAKMQRSPYEWLRGTASVFWRDLSTPGADRPATAFGDPASSRVLLVADPHPENLGTFRAADGTMLVDWNDFDSAGYGPFEGDLRRLATGLIVAGGDPALGDAIARRVAAGYVAQIDELAAGQVPAPVGTGAAPYLDKTIAKALANGDAGKDLDDYAPLAGTQRAFAFGDLDPVADDGVIENRLAPVSADEVDRVTRGVATLRAHHPELGTIAGIGRRLGSGVSSYAALRYYVLLHGAAYHIVELKEERDGIVIHGIPQLQAAEWSSPAVRVVDAQRRLQARPDADALLDVADLAPLAFRVHDHASYQRGVNADDLGAIVADPGKHDQIFDLAELFGRMLARAHGLARTEDGVVGWTVIAPVLGDGFADELAARAVADAAEVEADWAALKDRDLAALVLPQVTE
jgi:uncharacterized protein (DUF2252 family)